jgi:GT2 family glycosyltransferase
VSPAAAIVVNYNAGTQLTACLQALLAEPAVRRILVVDNASTDASPAAARAACGEQPRLTWMLNPRNVGFACAVNQALGTVDEPYALLVNPDCVLEPGAAGALLDALAGAPRAGVAGALLLDPQGREQRGCRRRLPTPASSLARVLHLEGRLGRMRGFDLTGTPLPAGPVAVEAVSGACMAVDLRAVAAVGPLDEGYFLHCEDLDWCRRFACAGWQVLFVPTARAVHRQGTCSRGRELAVLWHKHRGMWRYYGKFREPGSPRVLGMAVRAGIALRLALLAPAALWAQWTHR